MPRWGKVGKQKIEDADALSQADGNRGRRIRDLSSSSWKGKGDGNLLRMAQPTRMHIVTHLSPKLRSDAQFEERLDHS